MKILTIISNYNEKSSLLETINDINENASIKTDILVIDNASSDHSLQLAINSGIDYLQHPVNTGGSAGVIKTALLYAYHNNYDIYCHMDGDNQHVAAELVKIVQPILDGDADFVFGSRFINKTGFQSYFFRRIGIALFSKIVSLITGTKLTDITSGFRAYNRNVIEYFATIYKHEMEVCVQMPLVAFFSGFRLTEVPVIMRPRTIGKSEINFINAFKFPVYSTINLIGILIQRR